MTEKFNIEALKKSPKKLIITVISIVFAAVILAAAGIWVFILTVSRPMTVELGSSFSLSRITENPIVSAFCEVEEKQIDTREIGDHVIKLDFFGLVSRNMTVYVKDTTPPELELYDVYAYKDTELDCDSFIKVLNDLSDTEISFKGDLPETSEIGEFEVSVLAVDTSDNTTTKTAKLVVVDETDAVRIELGETDITDEIANTCPDSLETDLSGVDLSAIGIYTAKVYSESEYRILPVCVEDTVAPSGETKNWLIRRGQDVAPEQFVENLTDASEVKVSLAEEIDYTVEGVQTVDVILEDAAGNKTDLSAKIAVYDIPIIIKLTSGFDQATLEEKLFSRVDVENCILSLPENFDVSSLGVGDHEIYLTCEFGEMRVLVNVADDDAPVLVTKSVSVYSGTRVQPSDFVQSCTDTSEVKLSFEQQPSVDSAGMQTVTIVATDRNGNTSTGNASLNVIADTTPPVIYGTKDLSVNTGETVSYGNGVWAEDAADGSVEVVIDSSAVNLNSEGVYTVTYTATDKAGNTASVSVKVTVSVYTREDAVNQLADNILASIITDSMTPRERAWAIYSWSKSNIKYSTSTSYLMGNFVEGAYSGFTIRKGNCYIYYAVTSVLLTRAGIENIEIQRNNPSNPHYWNLVKIDGNWYHLDTCPQFAGHKITSFLLTDAEVKAYSQNEVKDYYSFDASLYPATP